MKRQPEAKAEFLGLLEGNTSDSHEQDRTDSDDIVTALMCFLIRISIFIITTIIIPHRLIRVPTLHALLD